MNETPERKPMEGRRPSKLSGRQKAFLFGVTLVVFISTELLLRFVFPEDCRIDGALVAMFAGIPTYFCGVVLLPAWSGGGDRGFLFREGGLFMVVVFANVFGLNLVKCYFEGAWYATASYMPVMFAVSYFLISRLMRVATQFAIDRPSVNAGKDGDAA